MKEQEILEANNMIAEFIGVDLHFDEKVYRDSKSELRHIIDNRSKNEGLLFHCFWDWIIPVVIKIENETRKTVLTECSFPLSIESVYKVVVKRIKSL